MLFRQMFQKASFVRFYSCEKASTGSLLATLRKKTGYSISNCKKALEKNGNDLQKAESWLNAQAQAQGWDRAAKLQNRVTLQGLVGIARDASQATIVEVNCETDFVARNEKFQSLVAKVAGICLSSVPQAGNSSILKVDFSSEQLAALKSNEPQESKLSDLIALNIGQIGENMNLRRASAIGLSSQSIKLACCTHPLQNVGDVMVGKYGAIVAYETADVAPENVALPEEIDADKLPRQLCQHVIGMNPRTVVKPESCTETSASEEETALYDQEFVASPGYTVGQILDMMGWRVHTFVRYECGGSDQSNAE